MARCASNGPPATSLLHPIVKVPPEESYQNIKLIMSLSCSVSITCVQERIETSSSSLGQASQPQLPLEPPLSRGIGSILTATFCGMFCYLRFKDEKIHRLNNFPRMYSQQLYSPRGHKRQKFAAQSPASPLICSHVILFWLQEALAD